MKIGGIITLFYYSRSSSRRTNTSEDNFSYILVLFHFFVTILDACLDWSLPLFAASSLFMMELF